MMLQRFARYARRLVIFVLGVTIILLGVVLLFTPGPALLVIPAGLAVLGVEFVWARRLLRRVRQEFSERIPESVKNVGWLQRWRTPGRSPQARRRPTELPNDERDDLATAGSGRP
jgi:hypothetical protein